MSNTGKLSYKEMQELLPDYVFDRLSENEKTLFEQELERYPDLQQELSEVRSVFGRLNQMDFNKTLGDYTRNTSVKVKQRLSAKSKRSSYFGNSFKYLVPTAALIFIAYFVFFNFIKTKPEAEIAENQKIAPLLSEQEFSSIFTSNIDEDELINISQNLSMNCLGSDDIEEAIEDLASNDFFNDIMLSHLLSSDNDELEIDYSSTFYYEFINNISLIEENVFQIILKEIEDVEINL